MYRRFLNAKIRDIRITGTYLDYEGSITLDEDRIEKAGMLPNEEVQVLNVETGARFTTYVIKGERGSGAVELNGPAARLARPRRSCPSTFPGPAGSNTTRRISGAIP